MDTKGGRRRGGGGGGGMNWEIGIDMYTLMCIKWMTSKNLLYKKTNKIQKFKKKKDSMLLAQKWKYRSVEQDRKPRDKPTHIWSPYL